MVQEIDIKTVFKNHWKYYSTKKATDISQITGLTKHISDEYQGRVIYELMQNAFDPAKSIVKIDIKNIGNQNYLVVSNDGDPFTFKEFNYNTDLTPEDNFHALCSIATSSKTVDKNIGNKGVGFKSVFSLSNEVYIISKQENEEIVSFKLFGKIDKDEFNEIRVHLHDFESDISQQSKFIEEKNQVLPGFYYPLFIENNTYDSLLDKNVVTAVAIPLINDEQNIDKLKYVKNLINDIEKYHFEFIKEKYKEKKSLKVCIYGTEFNKEILNTNLDTNHAIVWKNEECGFLYNFMPSLVQSPFKCMDINGEFQTSVNREYINFDEKSDIGKTNLEILKDAIKLHFSKLERLEVNEKNKDIFWKLLQINNTNLRTVIKNTILKEYKDWDEFSDYLVKLAKNYFKQENLSIENFNDFWEVVFAYIHIFANVQGKDTTPYRDKLKGFINKLNNIKVIYTPENNHMSFNDNIFFKDEEKDNIYLPDFLPINIVTYNFLGYFWLLKKIDKLKYFSTYDEILKHFRQISKDGEISKESLLKENQHQVLDSLYSIYKAKQVNHPKDYLTTHRYTKYLSKDLRVKANTENNANFAIATIFLKLKDIEMYKPTQILKKDDIDLNFHESLKDDGFLKFLGVSLDNDYIFCDKKIYDEFNKDNYTYIPAIVSDDNTQLKSNEIISNIIIVKDNKEIYPALVNENYDFLYTVKTNNLKPELDNLYVKQYDYFPEEYFKKLLERMIQYQESNTLIRLYSRIFTSYYATKAKDMQYLIARNNVVSFQKEDDFVIVKTKEEFELLKSSDLNLLCYYGGDKKLSLDLKVKIIELEYSLEIGNEKKVDTKEKENLKTLMPYILYKISQLDDFESKIDFLDNSEEKVNSLRNNFDALSFLETNSIVKCIKKDTQSIKDISVAVAYDNECNHIYYTDFTYYEESAKVISEVFFKSNKSIAQIIENVYLKQDDLQVNSEINYIKKIWDNEEYEKNYNEFLSSLFKDNDELLQLARGDDRWYEYSQNHESELIQKIEDLKKFSEDVKEVSQKFNINIIIIIDILDNKNIMQKLSSIEKLNDKEEQTIYNFKFKISKIEKIEYEFILNNHKLNTIDDLCENAKAFKDLKKENETNDKIKKIKDTLKKFKDLDTSEYDAKTSTAKYITTDDTHRSIVVRKMSNGTYEIDLKEIGDNGEHTALGYYINKFLHSSFNKKESLEAVYSKLKLELPKNKHNTLQTYYEKCLKNITNNDKLQEPLINLFFVALHYPFASFDIIAVDDNGKPLLVEVKTTKSTNNNSFRISSGEIKKAKSSDNYTIVRITPKKIIFIGNPIKQIKEKLTEISGDNFSIIPNGYTFKFTNKEE